MKMFFVRLVMDKGSDKAPTPCKPQVDDQGFCWCKYTRWESNTLTIHSYIMIMYYKHLPYVNVCIYTLMVIALVFVVWIIDEFVKYSVVTSVKYEVPISRMNKIESHVLAVDT